MFLSLISRLTNFFLRNDVNLARYYHTIRHLRPVQIYGRAWQRLYRGRLDFSPAPAVRVPRANWIEGPLRPAKMTGPTRFRFLNEERNLGWPAGWSDTSAHRLWLFNLHYFEDLIAEQAHQRAHWHQALIDAWIRDQGGTIAEPAWEPYVVSVRIGNWIKWALAGGNLSEAAVHSLAQQTRYLTQRVETHLLGNHLLTNAKALIMAGLFFEGGEAAQWLARGLKILAQQLPEQILADGGHYELSPMYHSLVLEDLLDLINASRVYPHAIPAEFADQPGQWQHASERMQRWLVTMTFPDGEISLFNDAAWGIAPRPAEIFAYANRLGIAVPTANSNGITHLRESGYARLQTGPAVVLVDVGEIGPAFLPGHGHADVLTFECAFVDERVVVNSGTSVYYGNPAERHRQRQTAAHNTVTVDDTDSSEVWDNFRVARRAHPRDLHLSSDADRLIVSCEHDGFCRLPGRVVHRRTWTLDPRALRIDDHVSGHFSAAVARFHLHPDIEITPSQPGAHELHLKRNQRELVWSCAGREIEVFRSTFHPEFGVSLPNSGLRVKLQQSTSHRLSW